MEHMVSGRDFPLIRENDGAERRAFFEQLLCGGLSDREIRRWAEKLDLDLGAEAYAVAIVCAVPECRGEDYGQPGARIRDGLIAHFLKYPQYVLLGRDLGTFTVLLMSDGVLMDECIRRCVEAVGALYETHDPHRRWHLAVSSAAGAITELPGCYEEAQRLWAYRYLLPEQHVLLADTVAYLTGTGSGDVPEGLDVRQLESGAIAALLKSAGTEEVEGFVDRCIRDYRGALRSGPFCQYLMLSVRFGAEAFVQSLGVSWQEYLDGLEKGGMVGRNVTLQELEGYLSELLRRALQLRDRAGGGQRTLARRAADYIDANFCRGDFCLNLMARELNFSPNYLSAVFSREMGQTVVDYLTSKRMERARELLRTTNLRSGQIAAAVGYRDCRYFSALFRKVHGCTPGEYRAGR